jgi:DNA-binding YbaB/EbfC family protein
MTKGKGFGFGLGKMKELTEAFKKAQQVQENAKALQERLEQTKIDGYSDENQLVTVSVTGNQEPLGVSIKPEAMEKSAEELSELVSIALKEAYNKSTEMMKEGMEEITGGLNIPGLS